jgi:RNA polymerase primary sigma factor
MRDFSPSADSEMLGGIPSEDTRLLTPQEERALLRELAQVKEKLAEALRRVPGFELPVEEADPQEVSLAIANYYETAARDGVLHARLGALYAKYHALRSRLAMANMRLVAHVAKRFRERGVAYTDLLQEGFCGLLESIDRFDLKHETKLATYATWWIRQAIQRAVAAGAYPVRLSPRHLRQLAQNQEDVEGRGVQPGRKKGEPARDQVSAEVIQRIHAATRPTVSLDAQIDRESSFSLLHTMSDPLGDRSDDVDMDETIDKLLAGLRPREQQVIALRFGLGGKQRLSLSQVGKVMSVSKERVRQIQDRAIEKLRATAQEGGVLAGLSMAL